MAKIVPAGAAAPRPLAQHAGAAPAAAGPRADAPAPVQDNFVRVGKIGHENEARVLNAEKDFAVAKATTALQETPLARRNPLAAAPNVAGAKVFAFQEGSKLYSMPSTGRSHPLYLETSDGKWYSLAPMLMPMGMGAPPAQG